MDKQKQIEELSEIQLNLCHRKMCGVADCEECLAEEIYNAGYRKTNKGDVILTKEEFDQLANNKIHSFVEVTKAFTKKAVETFAERLKEEDCSIPIKDDFIIILRKDIDEICKELTEG